MKNVNIFILQIIYESFMKQPIIKTKNFTLRPLKKNDARSIAEQLNNEAVSKYMSTIPYPYRLNDANEFILKASKERLKKIPRFVAFVIAVKDKVAGIIGLHKIIMGHQAEIGYWLGQEYWGKKIMSQVVKEAAKFGFKDLKLRRIFAYTFIFNKASMRVLEKNGFEFEGIAKKHIRKGGKFFDARLYAKLK